VEENGTSDETLVHTFYLNLLSFAFLSSSWLSALEELMTDVSPFACCLTFSIIPALYAPVNQPFTFPSTHTHSTFYLLAYF
jgi:hypothetical protein